jgi:hypothetical protein
MIELRPPKHHKMCSACNASPSPDRFCDLTTVQIDGQVFALCHDCAHELIEKLLERYYALWGQALMFSDAVEAEREACCRDVCFLCAGINPNYGPATYTSPSSDLPHSWQHPDTRTENPWDAVPCLAAAIRARGSQEGK